MLSSKHEILSIALSLVWLTSLVRGFAPPVLQPRQCGDVRPIYGAERTRTTFPSSSYTSTSTCLGMGKSISKQAELRKKMELAKQQKQQEQSSSNTDDDDDDEVQSPTPEDPAQLSDEAIRERNDRKRFEELLRQSKASAVWNDYASGDDDYKNQEQIQEDIEAQRRGVERLFEGDPAPTACFERLLLVVPGGDGADIDDAVVLGPTGAERLVPWLGEASEDHHDDDDYLIVVCDPRPDSPDLHTTTRQLWSDLPTDLRRRLVILTADTPSQTRRWLKKNGWSADRGDDGHPRVYVDAGREWMTAYTALGDRRWSMTLFVLAAGRVQKLVRDLDVYTASQVVPKAVAAFREAKL